MAVPRKSFRSLFTSVHKRLGREVRGGGGAISIGIFSKYTVTAFYLNALYKAAQRSERFLDPDDVCDISNVSPRKARASYAAESRKIESNPSPPSLPPEFKLEVSKNPANSSNREFHESWRDRRTSQKISRFP